MFSADGATNQTVTTMYFGASPRITSSAVAQNLGFVFGWGTELTYACPGNTAGSTCTEDAPYCALVEPHTSVGRSGSGDGVMQFTIPDNVAGVRMKVHELYFSSYQDRYASLTRATVYTHPQ